MDQSEALFTTGLCIVVWIFELRNEFANFATQFGTFSKQSFEIDYGIKRIL
jgi:hypothetical protein